MIFRLTFKNYFSGLSKLISNYISNLKSESILVILTINILILRISTSYGMTGLVLAFSFCVITNIFLRNILTNKIQRIKVALLLIIEITIFLLLFCSVNTIERNNISKFEKDFRIKLIPLKEYDSESKNYKYFSIIKELKPPVGGWVNRKAIICDRYYENKLPLCSEVEVLANIESFPGDNFLSISNIRLAVNEVDESKVLIHQFEEKIKRINSEPVAFGWAMFTGSKSFINKNIFDKLQDTGTIHLFAVSGLHIGFLYAFMTILCFPIKHKFYLNLPLKIIACLVYLGFIGIPQTGLRALLMISLFEITHFLRIKNKAIIFFCLTLMAFIVFFKDSVFSLSNQLSFTVVLFILFILNNNDYLKGFRNKILKNIVLLFFISIAASSGSFFLILDYFGKFPYLSVPVNIFISPFVFLFYILNVLFFFLFFIFDSSFLIITINYTYKTIYYIINTFYEISCLFPKNEYYIFNFSGVFHFFVFVFIFLTFCFKICFRYKIYFLFSYYFCAWTSMFLYSVFF